MRKSEIKEFEIPRERISNKPFDWFLDVNTGKFSIIGYIFHEYFNINRIYLDKFAYALDVSGKMGEEIEGFTVYNEYHKRFANREFFYEYFKCKTLDEQILKLNSHEDYKCKWKENKDAVDFTEGNLEVTF